MLVSVVHLHLAINLRARGYDVLPARVSNTRVVLPVAFPTTPIMYT